MGEITLQIYTIGNPVSSEDPKIASNFTLLQTLLNGNLDVENLAASVNEKLGVSDSAAVRRGKSIIATEESRTNTAYGLLATPDRVQNVVLPTDGLIVVVFQGMWKESVQGAARAAITLNGVAIQQADAGGLVNQETGIGSPTPVNTYRPLASSPKKSLSSVADAIPTQYPGDVTTGQMIGTGAIYDPLGGPVYIFAAAGTYDVSVQFKASSGSVTAKNRKLWVWTMGF